MRRHHRGLVQWLVHLVLGETCVMRRGMTVRGVAAVTLLLATAACLPTGPDDTAPLRQGMLRWVARAPSSYAIELRRTSCECTPAMLVPVRVTVRDRDVQSVIDVDTGEPVTPEPYHAMTVDQLFAVVAAALDQNAYIVTVEYDDDWGYPRDIYIDYDREMVDDELSITAQDLVPVQ